MSIGTILVTQHLMMQSVNFYSATNLQPKLNQTSSNRLRFKSIIMRVKEINITKEKRNLVTSTHSKKKRNIRKARLLNFKYAYNQTVVLGRTICDCEGQEHEFMNNCLNCGRIHCFEEGPGPCFFCKEPVCFCELVFFLQCLNWLHKFYQYKFSALLMTQLEITDIGAIFDIFF